MFCPHKDTPTPHIQACPHMLIGPKTQTNRARIGFLKSAINRKVVIEITIQYGILTSGSLVLTGSADKSIHFNILKEKIVEE